MPIKLTPDEIHMIHSIVTWKSQLIKSDMNLFTSFKRNKGNQRDLTYCIKMGMQVHK